MHKSSTTNNSKSGGGKNFSLTSAQLPLGLASVIFGTLMNSFGIGGIAGAIFIGLGIGGTCLELISKHNPYERLLRNCKIEVGEQIPQYLGKIKTSYGYCLKFSLPAGLSTNDFENKKLAIEQYLNNRTEITYKNKTIFVQVYEKNLDEKYDYEFIETKSVCEFALGYSYGKKLIKIDLEKIVHLLIAGETGSGKSTLLRVIITNLIKNNKKLSLHLIDLKNGAEFNVFRKCKQVKTFSRNIAEAEHVLSNLLKEVDRRYDLFFENNVVDIREYNKLRGLKKLDYQVCIIDEFADLQDEKGSISTIEALAAKARACGIHLIISTQRPDAKILNGRIKANIPGVIGLKTMNSLNSRIIIDKDGLERLRGQGHGMLKYGTDTEFQTMYLSVKKAREHVKDSYIEKKVTDKNKEAIGKVTDLSFVKALRGD